MKENIFINKKTDKRYELVTKDIQLDAGVYTLYAVDSYMYVLKKKYNPKDFNKDSNNQEQQEEQLIEVKEDSTQEWTKRALDIKKQLLEKGFLVITDMEEVRKISYVTRNEINSGDILGIRGFDKNFYIFTKKSYEELKEKILVAMDDKNTSLEDIIKKTNLEVEQIKGLIELLKEQTDIIEVHREVYRKI